VNTDGVPHWIVGAWERTSLEIAGAVVAGIGRAVWIQADEYYVDLRAPGVIASGTSFAGPGAFDGRLFTWRHDIDMRPRSGALDRGSLEPDGDALIERGDDLDGAGPYVERWKRLSGSAGDTETIFTPGGIGVRAGAHGAFALDLRDHGGGFAARYRRRVAGDWVDEMVIGDADWQPF
jgi:hypothetical protein